MKSIIFKCNQDSMCFVNVFQNSGFISFVLILLSIVGAILSFLLAKVDNRDKRKKYLGLFARDWKNFAAYISFISTILLLFFQNQKEAIEGKALLDRYIHEDSIANHHLDTTLKSIANTVKLQKETIDSTKQIMLKQAIELENQKKTIAANMLLLKGQEKTINQSNKLLIESDALTNSSIIFSLNAEMQPTVFSRFLNDINSLDSKCQNFNSDRFFLNDSCALKVQKAIPSINILIIKKDRASVRRDFDKDSVGINHWNWSYGPFLQFKWNESFPHLNPSISIFAEHLKPASSYHGSKVSSSFISFLHFETRIFSVNESIIPFSDLPNATALIIFNTRLKSFETNLLSLNNQRGNKAVHFIDLSLIQKREIASDSITQFIYTAKIKSGWRYD